MTETTTAAPAITGDTDMDDEPPFSASEALAEYLERYPDAEWDRDDVAALLDALAGFFWEDCGDEWQGFAIAMHGLRIAADATLIDRGQELAQRFLHHIGHAAAVLADDVDGDEWDALHAIATATKPWAWLDFDGAMRPVTGLPHMSDEEVRRFLRG